MEKTRDDKRSSERLIDKILSKFGMVKRTSQSTINWTSGRPSSSASSASCATDNHFFELNDAQSNCELDEHETGGRKLSSSDVSPFCEKVEKFIKYIGSVRDLNFFTYDYPNVLQNRIDANIQDLESMLTDVKAAHLSVKRLKMQNKAINKEKLSVKKTLKRLREDEVRELERVIALYDKSMLARWENLKTTQKPEVLEGLLTEIKEKQHALENLNTLATRKLAQLRAYLPLISDSSKNSSSKEKSVIPLPFPSFSASARVTPPRIPPPPPLPPPLAPYVQRRSQIQRSDAQRRRRSERREDLDKRAVTPTENNNLALVPLTFNNLPDNLVNNFYSTLPNSVSNSNHDDVSASSTSGSLVSNDLHEVVSVNNNSNESQRPGLEFHSEMRSVLQALFGDLATIPTVVVADSTSSNSASSGNPTTENTENKNGAIELYTLRN